MPHAALQDPPGPAIGATPDVVLDTPPGAPEPLSPDADFGLKFLLATDTSPLPWLTVFSGLVDEPHSPVVADITNGLQALCFADFEGRWSWNVELLDVFEKEEAWLSRGVPPPAPPLGPHVTPSDAAVPATSGDSRAPKVPRTAEACVLRLQRWWRLAVARTQRLRKARADRALRHEYADRMPQIRALQLWTRRTLAARAVGALRARRAQRIWTTTLRDAHAHQTREIRRLQRWTRWRLAVMKAQLMSDERARRVQATTLRDARAYQLPEIVRLQQWMRRCLARMRAQRAARRARPRPAYSKDGGIRLLDSVAPRCGGLKLVPRLAALVLKPETLDPGPRESRRWSLGSSGRRGSGERAPLDASPSHAAAPGPAAERREAATPERRRPSAGAPDAGVERREAATPEPAGAGPGLGPSEEEASARQRDKSAVVMQCFWRKSLAADEMRRLRAQHEEMLRATPAKEMALVREQSVLPIQRWSRRMLAKLRVQRQRAIRASRLESVTLKDEREYLPLPEPPAALSDVTPPTEGAGAAPETRCDSERAIPLPAPEPASAASATASEDGSAVWRQAVVQEEDAAVCQPPGPERATAPGGGAVGSGPQTPADPGVGGEMPVPPAADAAPSGSAPGRSGCSLRGKLVSGHLPRDLECRTSFVLCYLGPQQFCSSARIHPFQTLTWNEDFVFEVRAGLPCALSKRGWCTHTHAQTHPHTRTRTYTHARAHARLHRRAHTRPGPWSSHFGIELAALAYARARTHTNTHTHLHLRILARL